MNFRLTDSQTALRDRVRKFAQEELKPNAAYCDEHETFPAPMVARAAELGFLGLLVPKKYGGQELGPIEAIIAIEEMSKACAVTAEVVFDCILGPIQVIQHFGTDEQRERYLRRAATGEILIFTDATTEFNRDTVRGLVSAFADPRVGCVGAELEYVSEGGSAPRDAITSASVLSPTRAS